MVGANTFRNPGLTAKVATTLDNISGGRAVLGIGGAWFEREHEAFGIPDWSASVGERLDRVHEAGIGNPPLPYARRSSQARPLLQPPDPLSEPPPVHREIP